MSLRSEVLKAFKLLHRTTNKVFQDDHETITVIRHEINDQFRKNMTERDPEKIKKLVKDAHLIEEELRIRVIQVVEAAPGYYKAKLTEDHCISDEKMKFDINVKTKRK